jgi:organic hydroperoxide reductase OsmC/OhrA
MPSALAVHEARVCWQRQPEEAFIDLRYHRAHRWEFDGGAVVAASSAVSSVPLPYSSAENVDPEEALVAAVSSCHMLVFLSLAAREGWVVDRYVDHAAGTMGRNALGRLAMTAVRLAPRIEFSGDKAPLESDLQRLHHQAHEECYIANSVTASITIRGDWRYARA